MTIPPMPPLTLAAARAQLSHLGGIKCRGCGRVVIYATAVELTLNPALLVEAVTRAALSDGWLMYPQAAAWNCAACAADTDPACPAYLWAVGARADYLRLGITGGAVA